jgi:hypothetical protein
VKAAHGNEKNALVLWGDAPRWEYSTAPLMDSDDKPVKYPNPGSGGHAMYFNDQQASSPPPPPSFQESGKADSNGTDRALNRARNTLNPDDEVDNRWPSNVMPCRPAYVCMWLGAGLLSLAPDLNISINRYDLFSLLKSDPNSVG